MARVAARKIGFRDVIYSQASVALREGEVQGAYVCACLGCPGCEREVNAWWRRDVNHIGPHLGEHPIPVRVVGGKAVAKRELLSQERNLGL
jgi:hypothetical protein